MTTAVYQLNPRTELFAIAAYARARALAPETPDSERAALLALEDEWGWTAHYCYPGGPWERSNLKVVLLLGEAWREADAAGLPPFDLADPAAFLLDAAVTVLRSSYRNRPYVTEVEFTAGPFGKRIEWRTISRAVTRFSDGTERDDISYSSPRLHHFLYDLAALRPPTTGDTLTLRIAPGPSALPKPNLLGFHERADPTCDCPKTECGGVIVNQLSQEACPFHSQEPTTLSLHQALECPSLPPGTDTSRIWIVVLNEATPASGRAVERAVPYAHTDRSALGPRRLQSLVEAVSAEAAEAIVRAQLGAWTLP
ncbi:hypothetical protein AB0M58_14555 [Streptomyces bobili]|uniref:hypothetical protein n=1 Tax=Streptomyces bobili TaxID=67280 RepID=UPI003445ABB4